MADLGKSASDLSCDSADAWWITPALPHARIAQHVIMWVIVCAGLADVDIGQLYPVLTLAIGVHGPAELHVIVIGDS